MTELINAIESILEQSRECHCLSISLAEGAALAWLYQNGQVVERRDDDKYAHLTVTLKDVDFRDLTNFSQKVSNA